MMGELMAAVYDPLIAPLDSMGVRRWRKWVSRVAQGRVLELGVGTGLNLRHYPAQASVAAIDPDGASLQRARARTNGRAEATALYQATAESLPFSNEAFDAVIGTLVFCTISDPIQALTETLRVLKPRGAFRVIEHVRMHNAVVAAAQDWVTPLWSQVAGGCHLNRDTLGAVETAGFHIRAVHRHIGGLFIGIDALKP